MYSFFDKKNEVRNIEVQGNYFMAFTNANICSKNLMLFISI